MALRSCIPVLEGDLHLDSFHEEMKHTIWAVLIRYESLDGEYMEQLTTGVCINVRGYILVSSLCFEWADDLEWKYTIQARGFLGESYTQARRVKTIEVGFGLELLKAEGDSDYADFVIENENDFFRGRVLYSISHRDEYDTYNLLHGHLVSELITMNDVSIQEKVLRKFFDKHIRITNKHLLVIRGFCSHSSIWPGLESLGAPVFNSRGQIIGVIVASQSGFDYAIPSSYLIHKLQDIQEQ